MVVILGCDVVFGVRQDSRIAKSREKEPLGKRMETSSRGQSKAQTIGSQGRVGWDGEPVRSSVYVAGLRLEDW
jgi:hypothetical protein